MSLIALRESIKTRLESLPALTSIPVFLERAGVDLTAPTDAALASTGMAIVVRSTSSSMLSTTSSSGANALRIAVSIVLIEQPNVSLASGGIGKTGEEILPDILQGLAGFRTAGGFIALDESPYLQGQSDEGELVHVVRVNVPLVLR